MRHRTPITLWRCRDHGRLLLGPSDTCAECLQGTNGKWTPADPYPVVPLAESERLRAALEQIASPNRSTYEQAGDAAQIAREALDG